MNKENKINVFIDTNIYEQKQYDLFNNSDFEALGQYINEGKVVLYTHKIVIKELKNRFTMMVPETIKKYISFKKDLRLLKDTSLSTLNEILSEDLITDGLSLIDKFFEINNAIILDYTDISLESLFDDYFANKPPFENKKTKKHEFPDAVIIKSLIKNKPNDMFYIITDDDGWKEALQNESSFLVEKNIKKFLDDVSKFEKRYTKIFTYYNLVESKERIEDLIIDELMNNEIEIKVDGKEYDRKGEICGEDYDWTEIEDCSVKLGELTIQKISYDAENNKIEALLNYEATLEFEVSCSFTDYENSVWDSEDKEYIYKETKTIDEKHKTDVDISLRIRYDLSKEKHETEIITDLLPIELDQYTLADRIYPEPISDDFYED